MTSLTISSPTQQTSRAIAWSRFALVGFSTIIAAAIVIVGMLTKLSRPRSQ